MYYKNQLKANQGEAKKQWKTINSLMGRKSNVNTHNIELNPPCNDIPTRFNEHFLATNFEPNDDEQTFKKYLKNTPNFSMFLAPTNRTEIEDVISKLKSDTPGYDDISHKILRYSSSLISTPLVHIINLALKKGTFPDQLKQAKVIPLFKSGDINNINNYRPISILPAFSKIFEKIISSHLIILKNTIY